MREQKNRASDHAAHVDRCVSELIKDPRTSEAVRAYATMECKRGHAYYVQSLRRLNLRGGRVLDAGCGVGNWTLALAEFHDEVVGLEYNPDRLAFTRRAAEVADVPIMTLQASIEDLPFPDGAFDNVFCNGVIFLTDFRKAIVELIRVTAPGGIIYICADDRAWWDFLINDRGPREPHVIPMATAALANQAADLLNQLPKETPGGRAALVYAACGALSALQPPPRWNSDSLKMYATRVAATLKLVFAAARIVTQMGLGESFRSIFSFDSLTCRRVENIAEASHRVLRHGTEAQVRTLLGDLLAALSLKTVPNRSRNGGFCIDPWEFHRIFYDAGFSVLGSAPEGHLQIDPHAVLPQSMYPPAQGIYEIVARRPTTGEYLLDPESLRSNGYRASRQYLRLQSSPILTNAATELGDPGTALHKHWRAVAQVYCRAGFLEHLAKSLRASSESPEDLVRQIAWLVQDSVFHHPVVQFPIGHDCDSVDVAAILLSGLGRCGHAAAVVVTLARLAGLDARVCQLHKHVCAEVKAGDRWLLVDADLFKGGIHVTTKDGCWPTLEDLRLNPVRLDSVPAIGHQLPPIGAWAKTIGDKTITGYTDLGFPWQRQYASHLYFGLRSSLPAVPPPINVERDEMGRWIARSSVLAVPAVRIRIVVSSESRGWRYGDFPATAFAMAHGEPTSLWEGTPSELNAGVEIFLRPGTNFINALAFDEYAFSERDVHVWPGVEVRLEV